LTLLIAAGLAKADVEAPRGGGQGSGTPADLTYPIPAPAPLPDASTDSNAPGGPVYGDTEEAFGGGPPQGETIVGPPPGMYRRWISVQLQILGGDVENVHEFESGDGDGDEIDLEGELGLDSEDVLLAEGSAWIRLFGTSMLIEGAWLVAGFDEERTEAKRDFIHEAVFFGAGEPLEVDLELQIVRGGLRYLVLDEPELKLGIPFGMLWVREKMRVTHRETRERATGRIEQYSPYIGFYMDVEFAHGIGIETDLRMFGWGEEDDKLFGYVDLQGKVYVTPFRGFRLFVGARVLSVEMIRERRNDRSVEFNSALLMAGIEASF
jgi:hypothetical protein